jgi:hypothetical protein
MSDCPMSGTAFGSIVLHITPEAAAGGGRWRWWRAAIGSGCRSAGARWNCWRTGCAGAPPRRLVCAAEARTRLGPQRRRSGAAGGPGGRPGCVARWGVMGWAVAIGHRACFADTVSNAIATSDARHPCAGARYVRSRLRHVCARDRTTRASRRSAGSNRAEWPPRTAP